VKAPDGSASALVSRGAFRGRDPLCRIPQPRVKGHAVLEAVPPRPEQSQGQAKAIGFPMLGFRILGIAAPLRQVIQ
jgi:hypothetical protein